MGQHSYIIDLLLEIIQKYCPPRKILGDILESIFIEVTHIKKTYLQAE